MASSRDAPFGNDATPETVVKIIGSKYVSCVVYKPYIQAPRDAPLQTQDEILQPSDGPTKESIDTCDPLSHSRNTALDCEHRKQEANKENNIKESLFNRSFLDEQVFMAPDDVQCLTAPTGDQTFSFIHTFRRLCDAPQSVNGCKAQHPGQLQNSCKRPICPDSEEESLITTIRNELKLDNFSVQKLDIFQGELNTLDPTMSGFLRRSQINVLLLKLELPLSLPTIQKLFRMSAKPKDAELVNYEKLLQILKGALPSSMKSVEEPAQETSTKKQDLDNQTKRSTTSSAAYEKISQIMTQAIAQCAGKLDLEKISLIFQNKDRSHSGLLPAFEIVLVCQQHGLTVSPALLKEVLYNPHLCVKDRIRWQKFVELLHKAHSDVSLQLPAGKQKEGVCSMTGSSDYPLPNQNVYLDEQIISNNASINRPATQPLLHPPEHRESRRPEDWIDRFGKLEKALHLCDTQNTGIIEKERAKRLIHNYNHIYDLSLSHLRIDQALQKFHIGDHVTLEPVFQYLKEL